MIADPTQQLPKLTADHDIERFRSGAGEVDSWLRRRALTSRAAGSATVFVFEHEGRVLGFYALASASVERAAVPQDVRQHAPDPVPVLLLARLAVDEQAQRRGIARRLLQDALIRSVRVSEDLGFRALIVHCRDEAARDLYLHVAASFSASPTEPLHLLLPLTHLRAALAAGTSPRR